MDNKQTQTSNSAQNKPLLSSSGWPVITLFEVGRLTRRIVTPRLSFSPLSGGRVNPSTAMLAISRQGRIRLKK